MQEGGSRPSTAGGTRPGTAEGVREAAEHVAAMSHGPAAMPPHSSQDALEATQDLTHKQAVAEARRLRARLAQVEEQNDRYPSPPRRLSLFLFSWFR